MVSTNPPQAPEALDAMDRPALIAALEAAEVQVIRLALPGIFMLRRPVSQLPREGALVFVDHGDRQSWHEKPRIAPFEAGKWSNRSGTPLTTEPTYWSEIVKLPK